jgi:uncharacterized protein (TIGR03435 family)
MVQARLLGAVGIVAVVGGVLVAQTPAGPAFEVVSIKRNTSNATNGGIVNQRPDGGFTMVNAPVILLIARAYPPAVPAEMVGLPAWATSERYDVSTTSSIPNPTPDQRAAMLRAMLADRFRLSTHVESHEQSAYDLVMARDDRRLGPGLKSVTTDCEQVTAERPAAPSTATPSADFSVPPPPCTFRMAGAGIRDRVGDKQGRFGDLFEGEGTMESLAQALRPWAGRVVLNKTALSGSYQVRMNFDSFATRRGPAVVPPPDAPPSIFAAVQEQLGLKLESKTGFADVLVIDHVEHPTDD